MLLTSRTRLLAVVVAIVAALASVTALAAPSQAAGASIAGVVQDESSTGLAAIDVSLYKRQGGEWVRWESLDSQSTGKYRFAGLSAGAYRVCANEFRSSPHYFQRCWRTGADVATGNTIQVATDQVITGKRISLVEGGTISGVVTGIEPAIADEAVDLAVVDLAGTIIETIRATIGTLYTVGPLATGSYRVQFDRASMDSRYSGQFFDGISELAGVAAATAVSVTTGSDTPDVNATMTTGGSISGYTKTTTGTALEGCGVIALADDGVVSTRYDESSATGRFVITGLSPGSYKVVVLSCINIEKWYDESKATKVSALKADGDLVAVTDSTTTGIGTLKVKVG